MAELNITNIPAPRVPFIDERTGLMAREWYRFFLNMFVLTGSGSNPTTLDELQLGPAIQPTLGVTSVTGSPPVVSSGGLTPVISMPAATTSVDGYLTSIDWNTFNNKGTVTSVSVVSSNGLAGSVATATTTPAITLSTTITGVLKGNGLAISAATSGTDYAPATSGTSILYGNGAGGFNNVTIGSGITFTTGTLASTATGTVTSVTGTAPVVSSGGTTPAISMAAATTSVNGYLTSTDWTTFNNKGSGTVTSVSGTAGRVSSTGGTTPVIDLVSGIASAGTTGSVSLIPVVTIDTYGRVTSITTAANPQGTVTSVTGTAPVVSSGGATPAISMPAATTSVNGYLTSTDWTTFNNKGSVTSVSVVSANGLAGTVATATTTPAITLSTTITGLLKGNATAISAAVANTDYVPLSTVITKTADYTITGTDTWIINNKTGSTFTLTFPAASSWTGRYITIKNLQAQTVVSASSNIVPRDSTTAGTAILLGVVGNWATLVSDGTNWVIMQAAPNNILLLG